MSRKVRARRRPALRVEIAISGGVADVQFKSKGVEVAIFDYDVDGEDALRLQRDAEGRPCCIAKWAAADIVTS